LTKAANARERCDEAPADLGQDSGGGGGDLRTRLAALMGLISDGRRGSGRKWLAREMLVGKSNGGVRRRPGFN